MLGLFRVLSSSVGFIFCAIIGVISFLSGRTSAENAQRKEILKHAEIASKIRADVGRMSTSVITDELRRQSNLK